MKPREHPAPGAATNAPTPIAAPQQDEPPHGTTPNSCGNERTPAQWAWHFQVLETLRHRLLPTPSGESGTGSPPVRHAHILAASGKKVCDALWTELAKEADPLFEVDCALQRIHDGSYGFCEDTGLVIPPDRLRAYPWTRYALAAPLIGIPPKRTARRNPDFDRSSPSFRA